MQGEERGKDYGLMKDAAKQGQKGMYTSSKWSVTIEDFLKHSREMISSPCDDLKIIFFLTLVISSLL